MLDFARDVLPDDLDRIRDIFSKRGAYSRFEDLLDHKGALQKWYDFEAKATERALRDWCKLNDIILTD